jgi:hypothetical protein
MKYNKYAIAVFLSLTLNFVPAFMPAALSQTNNNEYGSLAGIVDVIAIFKKNPPLYLLPKGTAPVLVPSIPNPTYPVPITSTPSAPGKQPMIRWLLPGGPPPAQTPILPALTCNYDDC